MKNPETLFLKVVVFLMAIPILAVCILVVPEIVKYAAELFPGFAYWQYPVLLTVYATAIAYFVALYQTFKLLSYIDKNNAFSELSVRALRNIKYCAITISVLFAVLMPLLFIMAEVDDAPGLAGLGLVILFASIVVAVFAAVLQKLLKNAIDIKSENDLTV